jgi:mannosyltransferase
MRWGRRTDVAVLSAVTLVALALRLYGVGIKPLWIDEAYSLERARQPLLQLWTELIADHVPAYFALLWATHTFTGEAEWALRLPSVLTSASVAIALPLIGRELGGPLAGVIAAALFAFSPYVIFWSQEAKPEATALAVAAWSTYLLLVAARRRTRLAWLLYGAVSLLGLYTFYYHVFIFAAQNLAVAADCLRRRALRSLGNWSLGQVVLVALFAPWPLTHLLGHLDDAGFPPLGRLAPGDFLLQWINGPVGGAFAANSGTWFGVSLAGLAGALLAILSLVGLAAHGHWSHYSFQWAVLVSWLLTPLVGAFAVQLFVPAHEPFYLLPVVPAVLLLAAFGVLELVRGGLSRRIVGALACLAIALPWAGLDAMLYRTAGSQHPDWRDAAVFFLAHRQPGEVLIPDPAWQASTLGYYLPDPELLAIPGRPPTRSLSCLGDARRRGVPGVWVAETDFAHMPAAAAPVVRRVAAAADSTFKSGVVTLSHYPFVTSALAEAPGLTGWGEFLLEGGAGSARLEAPGNLGMTVLCDSGGRDVDLWAQIRTDKRPSAGNEFADMLVRWVAPDTSYLVRVRFDASTGSWLQAGRWVHGTAQMLGQEVPVVLEADAAALPTVSVHAQVVGAYPSQLRLKAWPTAQTEPNEWTIDLADETPELQAAGMVGLQAFVSTRAENTPVTIDFAATRVSAAP